MGGSSRHGLEVSGSLGDGSKKGQNSQEEQRFREKQAMVGDAFSLFSKQNCQLSQRVAERLHPKEAQLRQPLHPVYCVVDIFQDNTVRLLFM